MKTITAIFCIIMISITCSNKTVNHKISNIENSKTAKLKKDTLISLNDTLSIHFADYNEKLNLWFNLSIQKNNKKFRLANHSDYRGYGSELNISLSPNAKYLVIDQIIKGYVYENENDSIFHENFTCSIIDIDNVKSVMQLQQDCSGEWNDKNQWISGGKVIFE